MSNLNLRWTKGLDEGKKDSVENLIRNSHIVLSRLRDIIEEDLRDLNKAREADYENPSWAFLQAHQNGKQEYARQLLSLLSFLERKNT